MKLNISLDQPRRRPSREWAQGACRTTLDNYYEMNDKVERGLQDDVLGNSFFGGAFSSGLKTGGKVGAPAAGAFLKSSFGAVAKKYGLENAPEWIEWAAENERKKSIAPRSESSFNTIDRARRETIRDASERSDWKDHTGQTKTVVA